MPLTDNEVVEHLYLEQLARSYYLLGDANVFGERGWGRRWGGCGPR